MLVKWGLNLSIKLRTCITISFKLQITNTFVRWNPLSTANRNHLKHFQEYFNNKNNVLIDDFSTSISTPDPPRGDGGGGGNGVSTLAMMM